VSWWLDRRRGSLREREEEEVDDDDELIGVEATGLSSIDPFLDGTDVVEGTRPRRLKR
jgi:hypothetical protein